MISKKSKLTKIKKIKFGKNELNLLKFMQNKSFEYIISKESNPSKQGFIFEKLYDIMIKFGFCPPFNNTIYKHMEIIIVYDEWQHERRHNQRSGVLL